MNSEPRRGSRKGTQLAHPGAPRPILGWVVAAVEARALVTLAGEGWGGGAVKVRSLPAQAKGGRQQLLPIPILEATVAETGTVTCPRSQSRRLRLSGGLEAPGQGFFRDALIPSQL